MSVQKIILLKNALEARGWMVTDVDNNASLKAVLEFKEDYFEWKISRKGRAETLCFTLADTLGRRSTSLSDLFLVSLLNRPEVKLFFVDKITSNEWKTSLNEFVYAIDKV